MILLISPKHVHATHRFVGEAEDLGLPLVHLSVNELAARNFKVDIKKFSALFVRQAYPYFEEIIKLAKQFTDAGKYVVDSAMIESGFETSRWRMYQKLEEEGIPIPATRPYDARAVPLFPFILKWNYGFGGNDVHLIASEADLSTALANHPVGEWLVQEYIPADYEYQAVTVGHKSLPKILRFKIHPVKPSQSDGPMGADGVKDLRFKIDLEHYSIFPKEKAAYIADVAERSSQILGRELAKTDLLEKDGKVFVLEVNRSPNLLPFEPYTSINAAREFLIYIRDRAEMTKNRQAAIISKSSPA